MNFDDAYDWIESEIAGRIATPRESCRVLMRHIQELAGDHCEIGALYGGSAILTALLKKDGVIYVIDPVDEHGYYGRNDQLIDGKPSRPDSRKLRRNFRHFGVDHRIVHLNNFSDPFPIKGVTFGSAFVDGDHTFEGAYQDFQNLQHLVRGPIIYDNADDLHEGVQKALKRAEETTDWAVVELKENIAVLMSAKYMIEHRS